MPKITSCLWFDGQALQAAELSTRVFPNSKITRTQPYPAGSLKDPFGVPPPRPDGRRGAVPAHSTSLNRIVTPPVPSWNVAGNRAPAASVRTAAQASS